MFFVRYHNTEDVLSVTSKESVATKTGEGTGEQNNFEKFFEEQRIAAMKMEEEYKKFIYG